MQKYASVDEYLEGLDHVSLEMVQMLRTIITENTNTIEHIKWNSPSYVFNGEDRITFSVRGKEVKVVIHMGATRKEDKSANPIIKDTSGIVTWNSDIRGTISFESKADIHFKRLDFIHVIKKWLSI